MSATAGSLTRDIAGPLDAVRKSTRFVRCIQSMNVDSSTRLGTFARSTGQRVEQLDLALAASVTVR